MQQQELIERPDNEERERVAIEPVEQSPRRRAREILADGERGDVADAAPGKIAGGRVVHRMVAAPKGVGRKSEDADDSAEQVVRPARAEIGTVAAVVLDDEEAYEEGRS